MNISSKNDQSEQIQVTDNQQRNDEQNAHRENPFAMTEIKIEEVSIDGICGVY